MNPNKTIGEIMTTELTTVRPDDTLTLVRSIFEENDFHHLPVVNEQRNLIGIISKEDLNKVIFLTKPSDSDNVGYKALLAHQIMTLSPTHLDQDDTLGLAADIFLANKFHALPVVEDEKLIGILTTHDLLAFSFKKVMEF